MPHSRNGSKSRMNATLQRDVHRLRSDVGHLKEDLQGDLTGIAHDAIGAARTGVTQAKRAVQKRMRDARETGAMASETVKEQVTAHPLASLGIAAGVGLLIGVYLMRGRG